MKKFFAVSIVFCGVGANILVVNSEVFGDAVAAKCTAQTGQIVCASFQIVAPDATTRGTSLDWHPPYWS